MVLCEKNAQYAVVARKGRNAMVIILRKLFRPLLKKQSPTTMAVQRMGVSTSRVGSFLALQLTPRIAETGISQSKAK